MGASDRHPYLERNLLLRALPRKEYESLLPELEAVELAPQQVLYEPDEPIRYVYFPQTAVVSLLTVTDGGAAIETASIGSEGVVGLPVFIGAEANASRALVQIPSAAKRIEAGTFLAAVREAHWLRALLRRYTQALLDQTARWVARARFHTVACARFHTIEERCARSLLMMHDRVATDEFPLTQESLALILGVRRAGVTGPLGALQGAGLLRYRGGTMAVLDRAGLERASCECYRAIRAHFDRLLGRMDGAAA